MMIMDEEDLMRVCVVGGNAVSAFLSWRLQATNACDVTLVWKSGFDAVHQYGISFRYIQPAPPPFTSSGCGSAGIRALTDSLV